VGWTLIASLVQAPLLALPGAGKVLWARQYWRGMAGIMGLRIRVLGEIATARPVLFVSNHSSWLDIIALGATLPAVFVAKGEVGRWPGIGLVSRLGRTVFVSRNRATVVRETQELVDRLGRGDNIILFPEGTTSDGNRVLPFAPSFLALAEAPSRPTVQPVTIVYDKWESQPVRRTDRPHIAWYGDMDLATHFPPLARRGSLRASIALGTPIPAGTFASRKELAAALEAEISGTAAALRQGRRG
jgi:1-acyl-sn-glycerol-3-phosphate acyltransferase